MAVVTITGKAVDHSRDAIPAELQPELWFRPRKSQIVASIMEAGVESKATLDTSGGFSGGDFTVDVEGHTWYTPFLRWLMDASQANLPPEKRALGHIEFPAVYSGDGGPLSNLPQDPIQINGVWYGYGPPPDYLSGALYADISGMKMRVYAPANGGV